MRYTILKCLIAVLLCIGAGVKSYGQESLSVIGNAKGVPAELAPAQLLSIIKGERQRWGNGTKVVIALMKTNTPVGVATSKKVFKMSPDQVNKYWLGLVFQGKADAPTFFNSVSELEAFVAQTPGAIGIIGQTSGGGRIITVDGKRSL